MKIPRNIDPRDSTPQRWPHTKEYADFVYRLDAEYILSLEDKEKAIQMIMDFQSQIEFLNRYFSEPLILFLEQYEHLLQQHLEERWRACLDGNYRDQPHLITKDLLNLICSLAGLGPYIIVRLSVMNTRDPMTRLSRLSGRINTLQSCPLKKNLIC